MQTGGIYKSSPTFFLPMAFSSDFDEESDPSLCESDAPPSPEHNLDPPRSPTPTATDPFSPAYYRSRSPEYSAATSKSDGDNSDADSEETPAVAASRPKRAGGPQSKSAAAAAAAAANGRKSASTNRSFPRCSKRRVWSEEDEVKLLKEMAKLKKSGKEPIADLELFYQVHRHVNSDYTRAQVTDKVRRLKSKYVKIKETARTEGEYPVFPTTHEERLYNLSMRVWGGCVSVGGEDRSAANGRKRARKPPADDIDMGGDGAVRKKLVEFCLKYNGSLSEDVLSDGVRLMGSGRVKELDKLHKQVRTKEMEVEMMKAGLLREILEEVCDDGTE